MLLLTGSVIYNDHWNNASNHEDKGVAINFVDNIWCCQHGQNGVPENGFGKGLCVV